MKYADLADHEGLEQLWRKAAALARSQEANDKRRGITARWDDKGILIAYDCDGAVVLHPTMLGETINATTFAEVQNAIADDYDTEIAVLNIAKDDEVEMQTECLIIWPCIQDYGQMVAKIRRLLAVKPSPRPELSAKVDNGEAP